jgi:preprotein translocase subunit SecE
LFSLSHELRKGNTMAASVQKIFQFIKETRFELKRVTWPSRKETVAGTVVVLVIVLIVAFFLGIVDMGLSTVIKRVLSS